MSSTCTATETGLSGSPVNDRFTIVCNEEIFDEDAITVNAVHMYLTGPTAIGEMVIGQSHCDVVATSTNEAPTAVDDTYTTPADTPLTVDAPGVLGNDDDPEGGDLMAAGFGR